MSAVHDALLVKWTKDDFSVLCPFCEKVERHDLWNKPPSTQYRISACTPMYGFAIYNVLSPFDSAGRVRGYGWELDEEAETVYTVTNKGRVFETLPRALRKAIRPITSSTHLSPNDTPAVASANSKDNLSESSPALTDSVEGLGETLRKLRDLSVYKTADKTRLSPGAETRYDLSSDKQSGNKPLPVVKAEYFAACRACDLNSLEVLFKEYPDAKLTHQVDADGSTGVLLATAAEQDGLEVIRWLREKGASLSTQDYHGRSPLMEAALWGRLDIVRLLLDRGVDVAISDNAHRDALDLALDTDDNESERIERSGSGPGARREAMDASRNRRRIAELLKNRLSGAGTTVATVTVEPVSRIFFRLPDGKLALCKPSVTFDLFESESSKAIAELDRGGSYPLICSMSGYSQTGRSHVLDNSKWTNKVLDICNIVGHNTTISFASHAEKQLVAYYLSCHVLWQEEDRRRPAAKVNISVPAGDGLPRCTIYNSKGFICSDCERFLNLVEDYWNLTIDVRCIGEYAPRVQYTPRTPPSSRTSRVALSPRDRLPPRDLLEDFKALRMT